MTMKIAEVTTAATTTGKKRPIDDDSVMSMTVEAAKGGAAIATKETTTTTTKTTPSKHQQQFAPPPRFANQCLDLWFWSKPKGDNADDEFDTLHNQLTTSKGGICSVDIGAELWNRFQPKEVEQLMDVISKSQELKWLHFSLGNRCGGKTALSIKLLNKMMTEANGLKNLILKDLEMTGTLDEWKELLETVKSHDSLQHIRLENYSFQDVKISVGDLLGAVSSSPTLQTIEVYEMDHQTTAGLNRTDKSMPVTTSDDSKQNSKKELAPDKDTTSKVSPATLKSLLSNAKSLQVVRLCGLGISDDHINDIAEPLRDGCKNLKELLLWKTKITEKGAKQLSKAVSDHPFLKKLNLNDNDMLGSRGCQAIFETLSADATTTELQELYIGCRDMDGACRSALLTLISNNKSIEKLEVCYTWPKTDTVGMLQAFQRQLVKALRRGDPQVLQYVRLYHDGDWSHQEEDEEDLGLLQWATVWENPRNFMDDDDDGSDGFKKKEEN